MQKKIETAKEKKAVADQAFKAGEITSGECYTPQRTRRRRPLTLWYSSHVVSSGNMRLYRAMRTLAHELSIQGTDVPGGNQQVSREATCHIVHRLSFRRRVQECCPGDGSRSCRRPRCDRRLRGAQAQERGTRSRSATPPIAPYARWSPTRCWRRSTRTCRHVISKTGTGSVQSRLRTRSVRHVFVHAILLTEVATLGSCEERQEHEGAVQEGKRPRRAGIL